MKYVRGIYWMCIGAWLTIEAAMFFDQSQGGVMPMGQMIGIMGLIGGAIVFALLWKLISYWENGK